MISVNTGNPPLVLGYEWYGQGGSHNWVCEALKPLLSGLEFGNLLCYCGNTFTLVTVLGTMEHVGWSSPVWNFCSGAAHTSYFTCWLRLQTHVRLTVYKNVRFCSLPQSSTSWVCSFFPSSLFLSPRFMTVTPLLSSCSSAQALCLSDEPRAVKEYRYPEKLPGELYDADTQCKWQFGEKAKLCTLDFKKVKLI